MKCIILLFTCFYSGLTFSQSYCGPTFSSGCFDWNNKSINFSTVAWTATANCEDYDFTSMTGSVVPGDSLPMTVENGNWCGCSVWMDLNNDSDFDDNGENLYSNYVASMVQTYSFNILVPPGTSPGIHRMRVIASWGSDGVNQGANGFGPCGQYTYGNFSDFTMDVSSGTDVPTLKNSGMVSAGPIPVKDFLTVSFEKEIHGNISLTDAQGRIVVNKNIYANEEIIDMSNLSGGVYFIKFLNGDQLTTKQIMKN